VGALVVDLLFLGGYSCAMFGVLGVVFGLRPASALAPPSRATRS